MGTFVKGDVVVAWFPTEGGAQEKKRPAVVLAAGRYFDADSYLLCAISTQNPPDTVSLKVERGDVLNGTLTQTYYIHPAYLFTRDAAGIVYRAGTLRNKLLLETIDEIKRLLDA